MTICFVAVTSTGDHWDVCRAQDYSLWLEDMFYPISKGHSLESAMEMVAKLNDGVAAIREVQVRGIG